jgi:hypothetical protein
VSGSRPHRHLSPALVVLATLLAAACALSGYARSEIVDSRAFAGRVDSALDDQDVRRVLADRVVNGLAEKVAPDALVVRPLVVNAVAALADTRPFRRFFARTVRNRHDALVDGDERFVLRLLAGGGLLLESLRSVSPRVAEAIPRGLTLPVVALNPRDFERRAADWLTTLAGWWWPLLAGTLLAAGACAFLAGSLRTALVHLGIVAAGAGLMVAAVVAGLGAFVGSHLAHAADLDDEAERRAIHALWIALFGDLRSAGLLGVLGGLVLAVLASGAQAADGLAAAHRWLLRAARSPSPAARRVQAAALIGLGLALFFEPGTTIEVAAIAAGALLLLVGAGRLADRPARAEASAERPPARALLLTAAVLLVTALTVIAIALVLPGPKPAPAARDARAGVCNGSAALCDRRLNEVVFPATHNSYAAADEPGWFFANQRHGIARQLSDGVRGFLLDIHYGARDRQNGRIRTDLKYEGSSRNKVARELSPGALRTADRLVGGVGLGELGGRRQPYLCHTLCELGAEPLGQELEVIRRFLDSHRRVVIVLFIEPYVGVQEIERALEDAGLLSYAAALRRDEPLPTLRRLIRSGDRLVILTEEDGGARPWYLDGFSFAQDTPLGATAARQFSCSRYRGTPNSPLFLINHWIDTFPPSPSRNGRVGGRVLQRRLQRCERARGLLPNLVAVDFYERTGVVDIAERLNARR